MTSVVPEPDYWLRQVVLVAQRTQARGAQQETAGCGIEPWSRDDWQTVEDTPLKPTRLGIDYIDISGLSSQSCTDSLYVFLDREQPVGGARLRSGCRIVLRHQEPLQQHVLIRADVETRPAGAYR
jgi:hypothetical protein